MGALRASVLLITVAVSQKHLKGFKKSLYFTAVTHSFISLLLDYPLY